VSGQLKQKKLMLQDAWWELKIRLEGGEHAKLKRLAERAGQDISELVHKLIKQFIEEAENDKGNVE